MAVSSSTPNNIAVGAGDVLVDNAVVGASMDNNVWRSLIDWYVPPLNGVPGPLVGTDYKDNENYELETTIPEVTGAIAAYGIPGAAAAGSTTITVDTDGFRRLQTTYYHDWRLQVPGVDRRFDFEVDDAINIGGSEYEAADDGTLAPRLQLQARWNPADVTTPPGRIIIRLGISS
jgi:hypothetical protein